MLQTTLLLLSLPLGFLPADSSRLAVIKPAPGFALIDQNGNKLRMAELKEDVLLVSFIFTTCSGSCPATTHRMAKVQEALKQRGLLQKGKVRLISISLDPKRDTPNVLKGYMGSYEIDPSSWSFLTGELKPVARTIAAWGMWARPAANGQLDHPSRIFLVDKRQRVREIYNLGFLKTAWAVEDIEVLLAEK